MAEILAWRKQDRAASSLAGRELPADDEDAASLAANLARLEKASKPCRTTSRWCRCASIRRSSAKVISGWTGIPVGTHAGRRTAHRARSAGQARGARGRPGRGARRDRAARAHLPRRPRRSGQAGRRVPAGRAERRRQDRDRLRAGRHAVRRRAQHDHRQHVGVPGSAHASPDSRARRRATSATGAAAC